MKISFLKVLVVILFIGFVGVIVFRSPQIDEKTEVTSPVATPADGATSNQFLQLVPTTSPPVISEEEEEAIESDESEVVSITEMGFLPGTLAVEPGTTVVFVNDGQASHWPVSDSLPKFDAGKGLQTGEEYSFVFDKVGTWKYYDHLNTDLIGEVIVAE